MKPRVYDTDVGRLEAVDNSGWYVDGAECPKWSGVVWSGAKIDRVPNKLCCTQKNDMAR
jgi:hypothetical protein